MGGSRRKKENITRIWSIGLYEDQYRMVIEKGIKPRHVRDMIEKYQLPEKGSRSKEITNEWIETWDWRGLKEMLDEKTKEGLWKYPSLQLIGSIQSGKTFLVKALIENDPSRVYIVLDGHDEYSWLPIQAQVDPKMVKSYRIKMHQMAQAEGMFKVLHNMITYAKYPDNHMLIVEEALLYRDVGVDKLIAQSRKFLRALVITQQEIGNNLCKCIKLVPYA